MNNEVWELGLPDTGRVTKDKLTARERLNFAYVNLICIFILISLAGVAKIWGGLAGGELFDKGMTILPSFLMMIYVFYFKKD